MIEELRFWVNKLKDLKIKYKTEQRILNSSGFTFCEVVYKCQKSVLILHTTYQVFSPFLFLSWKEAITDGAEVGQILRVKNIRRLNVLITDCDNDDDVNFNQVSQLWFLIFSDGSFIFYDVVWR